MTTVRNGWTLDVRESVIPGRHFWTWDSERWGELACGSVDGDEATAAAHAHAVLDLIESGASYREVMALIRGCDRPADDAREADVLISRECRQRGIS